MKKITTDDMDIYGAVEALLRYEDGEEEWKLVHSQDVYRYPERFLDWRHTPDWVSPEQEEQFDIDDYAYALAQLTDDCEFALVRETTGLSDDEWKRIMRISHAAQKRAFG
jgi:hypothetical protein